MPSNTLSLASTATIFVQLVGQRCFVASWDCLLHVSPPPRGTNFHVAKSKSDVYFLQHENLLLEKVVIFATNNLNLQRNATGLFVFVKLVSRPKLAKFEAWLLGLVTSLASSSDYFFVCFVCVCCEWSDQIL